MEVHLFDYIKCTQWLRFMLQQEMVLSFASVLDLRGKWRTPYNNMQRGWYNGRGLGSFKRPAAKWLTCIFLMKIGSQTPVDCKRKPPFLPYRGLNCENVMMLTNIYFSFNVFLPPWISKEKYIVTVDRVFLYVILFLCIYIRTTQSLTMDLFVLGLQQKTILVVD